MRVTSTFVLVLLTFGIDLEVGAQVTPKVDHQIPAKRARSPVSDSDTNLDDSGPAPKRTLKTGSHVSSRSARLSESPSETESTVNVSSQDSAQAFLAGLTLKLVHRSAVFKDLGITSRAHFDALAHIPVPLQEVLFKELRGRGVVLVETLVLRSAFNDIRKSAPQRPNPVAEPKDVAAFLSEMRPSMTHLLQVFKDLDVDVVHLPVLSSIDEESYKVFEIELCAKGVSWVERLLLRAAFRSDS